MMDKGLFRFLGVGFLGYLTWYVLYAYWLRDSTMLDEVLIHSMVLVSEWVLEGVGYELYRVVTSDWRWQLGIANSVGMLEIGDACDGLVLFALFAVFILAFPGPSRRKLWFIPLGVVIIHLVNLVRVISLVILNFHHPDALAFNHDYTWTVLVYGVIFWLWFLWTDKFSKA